MADTVYSIGFAIEAVQHGNLDGLKNAIEHGISPSASDADGCTLLHWASINNRYDIAEYLIQRGAEVNKGGVH